MRIAFAGLGLVGLLLTVAIMMYLSANDAQTSITVGNQARQQVQQIAGVDASGNRVEDSYTLKPETRVDGKIKSFLVTRLAPGSPLETFFGLKKGDEILSAVFAGVQWNFPDEMDEESAELKVREAYVRSGQLIVMRDGQKLTLPDKTAVPASPANPTPASPTAATPTASPAQPNTPPESDPLKEINDRLHSLPGN